METHFQSCFLVNIWCGIIGHQVTWLFVFEEQLTSEYYLCFLEDVLLVLLEAVPIHIRQELWLQQLGTPLHFGR
jgi:hypothetical protein